MSEIFESGYRDARDGFELEYFIKRGISELNEIAAYKSGWWAYKSGVLDLDEIDFDRADIALQWKY